MKNLLLFPTLLCAVAAWGAVNPVNGTSSNVNPKLSNGTVFASNFWGSFRTGRRHPGSAAPPASGTTGPSTGGATSPSDGTTPPPATSTPPTDETGTATPPDTGTTTQPSDGTGTTTTPSD